MAFNQFGYMNVVADLAKDRKTEPMYRAYWIHWLRHHMFTENYWLITQEMPTLSSTNQLSDITIMDLRHSKKQVFTLIVEAKRSQAGPSTLITQERKLQAHCKDQMKKTDLAQIWGASTAGFKLRAYKCDKSRFQTFFDDDEGDPGDIHFYKDSCDDNEAADLRRFFLAIKGPSTAASSIIAGPSGSSYTRRIVNVAQSSASTALRGATSEPMLTPTHDNEVDLTLRVTKRRTYYTWFGKGGNGEGDFEEEDWEKVTARDGQEYWRSVHHGLWAPCRHNKQKL